MVFTKERLAEFEDIEDLLDARLPKEQRLANQRDATKELAELKALQEDLSRTVVSFMASEKIGVPALTERLGTSTRQAYKIVNADANLTLASLVELGRVLGRRPRIIWEKDEEL